MVQRWACATVKVSGQAHLGSTIRLVADYLVANPSRLSEAERSDLGIGNRLPASIDESLAAIEVDTTLRDTLGVETVRHYLAMKKAEQEMLNGMSQSKRRVWLMERY
jgi:glutamine synthetase